MIAEEEQQWEMNDDDRGRLAAKKDDFLLEPQESEKSSTCQFKIGSIQSLTVSMLNG